MTLQAAVRPRIESVDLLRGFVMVIMALDHTRDYFGQPGMSPTNLAQATAALFFTRWITNICAPVFFLLTGTGAGLALGKKTKSELSRFLLTRGLWLIFLEIVVLRCFALQFNFDFHVTLLVVIWALGWAMITLAALLNLPLSVITAFSVGHDCDPQPARSDSTGCSRKGSSLGFDSSLARLSVAGTGPHRLRRLSVDPVGGRHRSRFQSMAHLFLAGGPASDIPSAPGVGDVCSVCGPTMDELLRRPFSLVAPKVRTLHGAVFSQYSEVSTVAVVSSDDVGTGDAAAVGVRTLAIGCAPPSARLWPCTAFLLFSASRPHTLTSGGRLLPSLRPCLLDVPVARCREISRHAAAGLGIRPAHDLRALDTGRDRVVSRVPPVCRAEAAPPRRMAELFLNNLLDADALFVMAQPVIFVSKALPNCAQERQILILLFDPRGRKEVEDVLMILRANRVPPPSS